MNNAVATRLLTLEVLSFRRNSRWSIVVFLLLMSVVVQAQYNKKLSSQELSVGFGGMNYLGDISMDGQRGFFGGLDMQATRPMLALSYRHNYHARIGGRITTSIGQICCMYDPSQIKITFRHMELTS